jgi:hypothetical protein
MMFLRFGLRWCAPVGAGVQGTGGVGLSTPQRPADVLEADCSAVSPARQRPGRTAAAGQCRRSRTAQREPSVSEGGSADGRARRPWVDRVGSRSVMLGHLLTGKLGEWLRIFRPTGRFGCPPSRFVAAVECGAHTGAMFLETALLETLTAERGPSADACLTWLVTGEAPSTAMRIDVAWPARSLHL